MGFCATNDLYGELVRKVLNMKIELPQVGESVTEGVIGKWLKEVGDRVEKYDPLVEVVTDKVNMEMPSPVSGELTSILVSEGKTVLMGAVIAEIAVDGDDEHATDALKEPIPDTLEPSQADRIGTLLKDVSPVGPTGSGGHISEGPVVQRYSPAVSRLAAEHGIDLSRITGTGMGGRVTRNDVMAVVGSQVESDPTSTGVSETDNVEVVPLTPIRRTIAENMIRSATQIPQAWTMMEVDVTNLVNLREKFRLEFKRTHGVNLTYMPFTLQAVAASLKDHPGVNSSWGNNSIILKHRINIGVAAASDAGLVVPVIHDTDLLDVAGLAVAVDDLARRVRDGKLSLSDVQDSTFTINNTGVFGSVIGKPLINPPEAAIMNTEAVIKRPVVIDDEIVVRSIMNLCLTFDHRVLDGAEAGAFLKSVKSRLESIDSDNIV